MIYGKKKKKISDCDVRYPRRTAQFTKNSWSTETCLTLFNSEIPKLNKEDILFSGTRHTPLDIELWVGILFLPFSP